MTSPRLDRLYQIIQSADLDGLILNPGPSLTYLTGLSFHLMERPVVAIFASEKVPVIILPELETGKLADLPFEIRAFPYGENPGGWIEVFEKAAASMGLSGKTLGVESVRLRFLELNLLQQAVPDAHFIAGDQILASLRLCKGPDEILMMRQAVQIAQKALNAILPLVKIGMTERQLAAELTLQLLRAGSDSELPFQPIVASGPNSANPHAVPTDRQLSAGDLLLIDWGAAVNGYVADLTRTLAIAEVDPQFAKIARIVAEANSAGRLVGKPGIPAGDIDHAARDVINQAGYGAAFFHRTGHGIGLEAHEGPYMYAENQLILEPGMVYTVEPGIYLTGKGGVRIEDNIVVTNCGSDSLSNLVRDLIVVG